MKITFTNNIINNNIFTNNIIIVLKTPEQPNQQVLAAEVEKNAREETAARNLLAEQRQVPVENIMIMITKKRTRPLKNHYSNKY